MAQKFKIKSGDQVVVIAGVHKGSKGTVKSVLRESNRIVVEGVNMVRRHTKPTPASPEGKIVEKEAPIHISNVMLLVNDQATRVGRKLNENGKLVRYAKKTGEVIK